MDNAVAAEQFVDDVRKSLFLLIESNEALKRALIRQLREAGVHKITESNSGKDGWSAIKSLNDIGVLICSAHLADVDYMKIVKEAAADKKFQNTTLVVISSEGGLEHIQQAVAAGVDGYIVKPFPFGEFKKKIDEAVTVRKRKIAFRDLHVKLSVPVQVAMGRTNFEGICIELARNECQIVSSQELSIGTKMQLRLGDGSGQLFDPIPGSVSWCGKSVDGKSQAKIVFAAKPTKSHGILGLMQQYAPKG